MSQRLLAVSFTFLMLASALPAAEATHTADLLDPLPILPQAKASQECIPTIITPAVLARVNDLVTGDPAWYEDEMGVPSLCVNGEPAPQYVELVASLNKELDRLRNITREIQQQVDTRLEATLPEGVLPEDLVEPKVVLLNETFEGRRNTGFGDWKVVTERGEDPVWSIRTQESINGTRSSYRFGDDAGYEQGVHQWLVSPEVDLTAVKANKSAIQDLVTARDLAKVRMRQICYDGLQFIPPVTYCQTESPPLVGLGLPAEDPHLGIILKAYEMAFDATIEEAPVMQHAAFLDLTYRVNMANQTDGVRLWIYSGDRAPDRSVLFHEDFAKGAVGQSCARDPVVPLLPPSNERIAGEPAPVHRQTLNATGDRRGLNEGDGVGDFVCTATLDGGEVVGSRAGRDRTVGTPMPGMRPTNSFGRGAADPTNTTAFTGHLPEPVTARLNLTDWSEQRIWLLFEVKTARNDRGGDTFRTEGLFDRFEDYGFEIGRVFVQGDGYHRNLRLKDVGATFPYVVAGNEFGDDPRTVRTTLPPGNESIVVYIHNAGEYTENATFRLAVASASKSSPTAFSPAGSYTTPVRVAPDEVKVLRVPWSQALSSGAMREDLMYRLNGSVELSDIRISIDNATQGLPDELPPMGDPNQTVVRPANAAGTVPGAGTLALGQLVRSDTARNLTPVRLDGEFGVPLQFCSRLDGRQCDELYAAAKGEQRIALIAVRNDGNTPQDIVADLHVELAGVAKPDIIAEGVRQTLRDVHPGETRAIEWTLTATEPGAYRVAVALFRSDGTPEPLVERMMFAQRSTGLMCLDALDVRECGPAFSGGLVPALNNEDITAATLGPDGTLYVTTEITEADPDRGFQSGKLAARSPNGEWRELANITGIVLNETFNGGPWPDHGWGDIRSIVLAPDGSLWLVGENATILQRKANGDLVAHRAPETVYVDYNVTFTRTRINETTGVTETFEDTFNVRFLPDLHAAAWHAGTLLVGGQHGELLRLNGEKFESFTVTNTSSVRSAAPVRHEYDGDVHALVNVPNNQLLLLGDAGVILRHVPGQGWSEATIDGNVSAWALGDKRVRAAQLHEGRIFIAGEDTFLVSEPGSTSAFRNITAPAPLQPLTGSPSELGLGPVGSTEYVDLFVSHLGELFAVDYEGRLATCADCTHVLARWEYPEIGRPVVFEKGPAHPAILRAGIADATRTFLFGEGGLVLALADDGVYANRDGWTTVPALAARDGGVIETGPNGKSGHIAPTQRQAFLGLPDAPGAQIANEAEKFRLYLNHSVANASLSAPVEVHLVYTYFPAHALVTTNSADTCGPMTSQGAGLTVVCNQERFRHLVAAFTEVTSTASWEPRIYDNLPSGRIALPNTAGTSGEGVAVFHGLELYAVDGTRWAIDDLHLQAYSDRTWKTVLEWRGPTVSRGTFWMANVQNTMNGAMRSVDPNTRPGNATTLVPVSVVGQNPQWTITPDAPFDLDMVSPWHLTMEYADRPVFAANSEAYLANANANCCATGNAPRLYSNWNSRLVSPSIDLRHAHDPVVVFDHTYAFRAQFLEVTGPDQIAPGDGGYIEVQYLKQGAECGAARDDVSCGWSRFYPVRPDAGYPDMARFGLRGLTFNAPGSDRSFEDKRIDQGKSYWGRKALPDDTGFISGPRLTDTYEQERITLSNVTCTATQLENIKKQPPVKEDCVPVNLTGRQIRVAFHLLTHKTADELDKAYNATVIEPATARYRPTFPGEGWYISDFKVLGASKLGIDLVATNMSFRVGYDVDAIGVGPGTRVPINVTVVNNGTFDALGYTARLQVDRVTSRALKTIEPVETVPLAQQPVLDAGKSVNHTLFWNVPLEPEGAEYLLTFHVDPIGIDRDEDFLDNVATLGTTSDPIIAKTVRRFNTEFIVSPENATIDITRYIPMFINNTGNVPLDGFTVERRITIIGRSIESDARSCEEWRAFVTDGRPSAIVDCRVWLTDAPAPPGTLTPLTAISGDVNPSSDLFWKAPERANYLVSVSAEAPIGSELIADGRDRRVSAFATYLFDDVEGGPRGEADSGAWNLSVGWAATQPGFRSTDAYAFGDPLLGRYPADANASMVSPTIDLGNARVASVGWFHKYKFETGFDAGVVEASVDGVNWTVLPVAADSLVRAGYNASAGFHVQPSSPVHPDGDPDKSDVRAFTGDSSLHPANVEGWVFSQLDLTDYAAITEAGLDYEAYTSIEFQAYSLNYSLNNSPRARIYSDPSWCPGDELEFRCWEVENVTQGRISPLGRGTESEPNTFWWSGSPNLYDDGVRPIQNHLVKFPIEIGDVADDQVVTVDWWELASRFNEVGNYRKFGQAQTERWPAGLYSVYMYHSGLSGAETTRFNVGQPELVGKDGKWYHLRSDITEIVRAARADGRQQLDIGFAYTPISMYSEGVRDAIANPASSPYDHQDLAMAEDPTTLASKATQWGDLANRYADTPGFAIDGLSIQAQRIVRGQPLGPPLTLADETTAWETKLITECGTGAVALTGVNDWKEGGDSGIACLDNPSSPKAFVERTPFQPDLGRNWNVVTELPAPPAGWGLTTVKDHEGKIRLPTGQLSKAWYSGGLRWDVQNADNHHKCVRGPDPEGVDTPYKDLVPCPSPGTESRLITPAFDLGRVAGDNAQLRFWHRYAFGQFRDIDTVDITLDSGGVIEYQEYDAQTKTWSAWKQLYDANLTKAEKGGYTAAVSNFTRGSGGVHRFDPPFENNAVPDHPDALQFLYSGRSPGWTQAEFDIDQLIGKRVRFGFHVAWSEFFLSQAGITTLADPDGSGVDRGGWWIADVGVVGNVIVGEPVQLRWRAGTDGNVHDGSWLIDDIGVFGARYRNNVGLFVDTTPGAFGAYNNTTATIPVTVRNLGDSVRRGLAVEVVNVEKGVALNLTAPGASVRYTKDAFILEGITLSPGQSTTIDVVVRAPRTPGSTKLLLTLKEFSDASPETPFVAIVDNEVQGLLTRTVGFEVQRDPVARPLGAVLRDLTPDVGEPVEFNVTYRNDGYGPSVINVSCKADVITGWDAANHLATRKHDPTIAGTYPCELVGGGSTIPGRSNMTLTYRVVPLAAGHLRVTLNGTVRGGTPMPDVTTGVRVGLSPVTYQMGFDDRRQTEENFSFSTSFTWDHLRGRSAPGALVVGIDENSTKSGQRTYNECAGVCRVVTDPIDLHNYSASNPAFLSFWHMDRLAKYDGARVVARVLQDETKPNGESGWSPQCVLEPRDGWEGHVERRRVPPASATTRGSSAQPDNNAAWDGVAPAQFSPNDTRSGREFFVSENGVWEETWDLEVFDLRQPCFEAKLIGVQRNPAANHSLLGRTVRFEFEVMGGQANGPLNRGRGQGMLVDDISIGPLSVDVRPLAGQRASMLDNTTKAFNVLVINNATVPDVVRLEYDAGSSSAPEGSVRVPADPVRLAPGESRVIPAYVTLPRDPSLLPTDFSVRLVARSIIDPNAAGDTRVDLSFGPRQWAELSIVAEAPKGLVQEGTESFIPITIENNGLVESVNTTIRITDTWANGSAVIEIPLSSIAAYAVAPDESTRVVEFRWRPEKGSLGVHTLTFELDPDILGEEYTRLNNVVTLTAPVVELLIPDLHVANFSALALRNAAGGAVTPALDADVARYEVTAGELVTFELKIVNNGRAGATNVDVRAFIGALSLPPKTIPYIAPGTEAVVTFNWLAQKGEHELEFLVRSEQVELSSTNNRYPGLGVALLTVKGYEVEVAIEDLAARLLEPGQTLEVNFSIRNAGNAGEDLTLKAVAPPGARIQLPREGFFLRAGETYSDRARFVLDAAAVAGEQLISIEAIARENPMKVATGSAAVRVNASYGGSVAGAIAAGAPPGFVLPIELINEGNSLEPWTLDVRLPAGWSAKDGLPAKVVVPAHGRIVHEMFVNVPVSTAPGDRSMSIKATLPNGATREGIAKVTVLPLRSASVLVSDAVPKPDHGALTVPVIIENRGNVEQPFEVLLVDPPAGIEMTIEPSTFQLAPGAKAVASLVVKPNASVEAGTYAITSYALFEGVTPQTAEGRANLQTIKVPVVRQDLRLSPLEFSPRAGLEAGDRVSVKVSVTNRGLAELVDVPVHLYADDVFIEEVIVASLPSGARADVTFNWTALTGVHTLTAVVDPYVDTVDGDRADNAVSALATVGEELPAGGIAAGRAGVPAPGLGLLLVVALVAALLTRSVGSRRQRR